MNIPLPIVHDDLEHLDLELSWTTNKDLNKRMSTEELDGPDRKRKKGASALWLQVLHIANWDAVALTEIALAECLLVPTEDLLARLDQLERPGISEEQFDEIVAKCTCGMIVTRRRFADHECLVRALG